MKDYPASKDREAALFNAARLLEGQQRYHEAAAAFLRYADLFPKSGGRAEEPVPRRAHLREAGRLAKSEISALNEFITQVRQQARRRSS